MPMSSMFYKTFLSQLICCATRVTPLNKKKIIVRKVYFSDISQAVPASPSGKWKVQKLKH